MTSRAGPGMSSVVPVIGPHILEALDHPEMLSLSSPQLGGAVRLVFVGLLLLLSTRLEACWFRWVILQPLAASLQSGESLSQHRLLDTCPAVEPFLHWDSSCSLTSLLVQPQHPSVCRASAMQGAETWERPRIFPAESSLPRQGECISLVLLYSCGN